MSGPIISIQKYFLVHWRLIGRRVGWTLIGGAGAGDMGIAKAAIICSPAASVQARRAQRKKMTPFERLAMEDAALEHKVKARQQRRSSRGRSVVEAAAPGSQQVYGRVRMHSGGRPSAGDGDDSRHALVAKGWARRSLFTRAVGPSGGDELEKDVERCGEDYH